jgi:hypothetical protein
MKYTNAKSGDWVELAGCADLPMRELELLYAGSMADAYAVAQGVVTGWQFTTKGKLVGSVKVGESAALDVPGLSLKQWDWLRDKIFEAARDEVLDPLA